MARGRPKKKTTDQQEASNSYLERVSSEVQTNQSRVSLVLGVLIVLVVGILVYNYFNKSKPDLGPAQQTEESGDVSPENLPGKYTVKEGDTLFVIADKYYKDGYKYTEIAKANNLTNPDALEKGQVLEIPKLETAVAETSPTSSAQPSEQPSEQPTSTPEVTPTPQNMVPAGEKGAEMGTGTGGGNTTIWGEKIEGDTYTVAAGDWLSKIAGRAYGDIFAYNKIAAANNITNPNLIEPGTKLKIPR